MDKTINISTKSNETEKYQLTFQKPNKEGSMKIKGLGNLSCIKVLYSLIITLPICFAATSSIGEVIINPEADKIFKSMSTYLGGTKAFSVNADVDFEIVVRTGQKLQLSSYSSAVVQRPSNLYVERKGMITDVALLYNGNTLTLHSKNLNAYYQLEGTGTIDDAFLAYEMETGIPAPGADLLFADPYTVLSEGVDSIIYIGISYVNGVACHHLGFRETEVDWQLWIQTGDKPLPMKYVITSKWQTGAPQYEIRFRDWNTDPEIDEKLFTFSAPEGAEKLETMPLDEMAELTSTEDDR